MNGLEQQWSDRVEFQDYNILAPDGDAKMQELGMHYQGYAIVDPYGRLFFKTSGHGTPVEELEKQIEASLAVEPP